MNQFTDNKLLSLMYLLIFVLVLSRSESGQIRCMEKEKEALLLFREGLKDEYGSLSSWLSTDECCDWEGVRCSNHTNHVVALHLSDAGLVGVVPDQLQNLSCLRALDLSFNDGLTVRNLGWLSHLQSLRHLDLGSVKLSKVHDWSQAISGLPFLIELKLASCELPKISFPLFNSSSMSLSILDLSDNHIGIQFSRYHFGLFNRSSLTSINLGFTGLFGTIPRDFGNLNSLEHLDLSFNDLEGGVMELANLSSLIDLDLTSNRFNGTVPPSFGRLPKLKVLDLSSNQFEGGMPDFMQSSSLRFLWLFNNKLNGRIPESIGSLSELVDLFLSSNHLEGQVSELHLLNLTQLESLDLSGNSLVLEFSSDWVPPFSLSWMALGNCRMGPHFPSWLQSQKHLEYIDISASGIDDVIPNWFWDLSSTLTVLNLSNNHIHGILPDLSLKFDGCTTFDLSSNSIEGPIPKLPANTVDLFLSNNKFEGPVISLCTNNGFFNYIDLSNNLLSGWLPDCLMQFKLLCYLNLKNNNFSGSIPGSIGLLSQIQSLNLRNNSLEGELPTSLQRCQKLSIIDIGQNKLTGKIPVWLGRSLSSLVILSFRSNQFKGTIPSELCHLKMIHILDISVNNISGTIPKCLRNFTSMARKGSAKLRMELNYSVFGNSFGLEQTLTSHAEAASLLWKGIELEYRNTLGLVKGIDLSSNKLSGEIPSEITYLGGLLALNISRNNLHGKIPQEIGHLQLLEFLDLSRNQLSGMIPTSLSQLNSIGALDLSYNNLSGKIPLSTQLQSFNASSYSGNPSLCGPPLQNLCPEDKENFAPRSSQASEIQEDEKFISPGFYAALGIGFTVGLWGTLGSLLLNNSRRVAYFSWVAKILDWLYMIVVLNMAKVKRLLKK